MGPSAGRATGRVAGGAGRAAGRVAGAEGASRCAAGQLLIRRRPGCSRVPSALVLSFLLAGAFPQLQGVGSGGASRC